MKQGRPCQEAKSPVRTRLHQCHLALTVCLLLWLSALPALAQIRGGEEAARFQPGDVVLLDEDYTSLPLGAQVPGWKILDGSYEVAEFQGQRWLRPLIHDTKIVRRVKIPKDFSLEYTVYLFPEDEPALHLNLLAGAKKELKERLRIHVWYWGGDHVEASVWDQDKGDWRKFAEAHFPNKPHRIALSVRNEQLHLYVDNTRVGFGPFRLKEPLAAIFLFFRGDPGGKKPYRDRPALFTNLRLAGYSTPQGPRYTSVLLYLMVPPEAKGKLGQPRGKNPSVIEELKKRFGWWDASPIRINANSSTGEGSALLEAVLTVPLPAAPFREGDTSVRMGGTGEGFIKSLREALELVRKEVPEAALLVRGQVLEGEGTTERERALLRNLRTLAFASWLAEHGLGDPKSLASIVADNSSYKGILIWLGNGRYVGVTF